MTTDQSHSFGDARDDLLVELAESPGSLHVETREGARGPSLSLRLRSDEKRGSLLGLSATQAALALGTKVHQCWKLGEYDAVYDPSLGEIEASIRLADRFPGVERRFQRLPGYESWEEVLNGRLSRLVEDQERRDADDPWGTEESGEDSEEDEAPLAEEQIEPRTSRRWSLKYQGSNSIVRSVEFGSASSRIVVIGDFRTQNSILHERRPASITLTGVEVDSVQQAIATLEKVSSAVFFELDVISGTRLALTRSFQSRAVQARRRQVQPASVLAVPRTSYSHEAISLYMQGRAAAGMPLLQYLAFYQASEHFFPYYTRAEALRRLRTRMQHPQFDPASESELNTIVNLIRTAAPEFVGAEQQLRATIGTALEEEALKSFLLENDDIAKALNEKDYPVKGIRRVSLQAPSFLADIANRVTDLRNRIVHTREDREAEARAIFPESDESRKLSEDIQFISFLAREVIVASAAR